MAQKKGNESERKLCLIEEIGKDKSSFDSYKRLVEGPRYVCTGCGRVAKNDNNLCAPQKM